MKNRWSVVFIFITISFCNSPSVFANELTKLKYSYGRRELLSDLSYKPGYIYPLESGKYPYEFIGRYFSTSSIENRRLENEHGIFMNMSVKKQHDNIVAVTKISNRGSESYFIRNATFPQHFDDGNGLTSLMQCWSNVIITTDDIMLYFFGSTCDGLSLDRNEWTEIKPHDVLEVTTVLNESFEFLTDKRRYEIFSSDYWMVKESWFVQRSINELLFPILNMNAAQTCPVSREVFYIYKEERICESYFDNFSGIAEVLYRAGINGESNDNEISIRSEPVMIEIDGSKIRSLYDSYPYKRKR